MVWQIIYSSLPLFRSRKVAVKRKIRVREGLGSRKVAVKRKTRVRECLGSRKVAVKRKTRVREGIGSRSSCKAENPRYLSSMLLALSFISVTLSDPTRRSTMSKPKDRFGFLLTL